MFSPYVALDVDCTLCEAHSSILHYITLHFVLFFSEPFPKPFALPLTVFVTAASCYAKPILWRQERGSTKLIHVMSVLGISPGVIACDVLIGVGGCI